MEKLNSSTFVIFSLLFGNIVDQSVRFYVWCDCFVCIFIDVRLVAVTFSRRLFVCVCDWRSSVFVVNMELFPIDSVSVHWTCSQFFSPCNFCHALHLNWIIYVYFIWFPPIDSVFCSSFLFWFTLFRRSIWIERSHTFKYRLCFHLRFSGFSICIWILLSGPFFHNHSRAKCCGVPNYLDLTISWVRFVFAFGFGDGGSALVCLHASELPNQFHKSIIK